MGAALQHRDAYSTVTGAEGTTLKQTLGALIRKSSSIFDSSVDFARRGSFSSNGSTPTKMPTAVLSILILLDELFNISIKAGRHDT